VAQSLYHFYTGEEILAYRFTGIAVRGSIEMGLHRRSTWLRTSGIFPGELQRSWALKLFWCVYIADRRWSLGTGMPFALQDSDIDTEMPEAVGLSKSPSEPSNVDIFRMNQMAIS
jgi:Fungal specific transcription factor domain